MINCDGNMLQRIDLWLDLRGRLPFPDESVGVAYCSHTLEHLFPDHALKLLREIHRVLRSDGVARIVVPDVKHALRIANGQAKSPWPRRFQDPVGQAMNYLFCDGQHKYAYNHSMLESFATQAGFGSVTNISDEHGVKPRPYGPLLLGNEAEGSLVVELRR
jgi:predicted SAM-dependent methyltransferase